MSPRLFWAFVLCSPLPLVLLYSVQLWNYEHYRFFPMLFAAVAFLIYSRWDRVCHWPKPFVAYGLLILGFALLGFSLLTWSPWTAYSAWMILFTSFCLSNYEKSDSRPNEKGTWNLFYLSIPGWLCLRLPLGLDENIPLGLQRVTARFSSFCLDQLNIPHHLTGVIFDLPKGKLFIEEACSGIQSVFTLACVSLLLMAYYRRSTFLLPFYLLAAVFSASLMNVVRIVTIALAQEWYSIDLAHGWMHDALGYCCLITAMLLLASFDRFFHFLFFPVRGNELTSNFGVGKNPIQIAWNFLVTQKNTNVLETSKPLAKPRWVAVTFLALCLSIFGYQFTFASAEIFRNIVSSLAKSNSVEDGIDEGWKLGGDQRIWNTPQNLFDNIDSIEVTQYENKLDGLDVSKGQFADIWNAKLKGSDLTFRLAISQPYNRFHDLSTCYTGVGWNIVENKILTPPSDSPAETWPIKYSSWETPDGLYGYLTYSGITRSGEPIFVEDDSITNTLRRRFRLERKKDLMNSECLMFQIWSTSTLPLSKEQVDSIVKLHFELEMHVLKQMRQDLSK